MTELSEKTIKFILNSYNNHNLLNSSDITIDEYLNQKLKVKDSFITLQTNEELEWIDNIFDSNELDLIRSRYVDKKEFFKSKIGNIDLKFKISIVKNVAAEVFVKRELELKDLRFQNFKVIFCDNAKLNRPKWILLSHQKNWIEHEKLYLAKKYSVVVTLEDNKLKIVAVINKDMFNSYAKFSKHSNHIIINKEKFLSEQSSIINEFHSTIIYQTYVDKKIINILYRMRTSDFSKMKSTQEMFELIIRFWHSRYKLNSSIVSINDNVKTYTSDSSKTILNFNKNTKDLLNDILKFNKQWKLEHLISVAFTYKHEVKDWYFN